MATKHSVYYRDDKARTPPVFAVQPVDRSLLNIDSTLGSLSALVGKKVFAENDPNFSGTTLATKSVFFRDDTGSLFFTLSKVGSKFVLRVRTRDERMSGAKMELTVGAAHEACEFARLEEGQFGFAVNIPPKVKGPVIIDKIKRPGEK